MDEENGESGLAAATYKSLTELHNPQATDPTITSSLSLATVHQAVRASSCNQPSSALILQHSTLNLPKPLKTTQPEAQNIRRSLRAFGSVRGQAM